MALVDALGNLVRLILPPGRRHDGIGVELLITVSILPRLSAIGIIVAAVQGCFSEAKSQASAEELWLAAALIPLVVAPTADRMAFRRHPIQSLKPTS